MGALALLLPFADDLIKKLFPDPQAQADAQLKVLQLAASGELAQLQSVTDLAKGQLQINQVEAASPSLFVAGWRPFIGWTCGVALAFDNIIKPMVLLGMAYAGHPAPVIPDLSSSQLYALMAGLLGLGTLRTLEKTKGVA